MTFLTGLCKNFYHHFEKKQNKKHNNLQMYSLIIFSVYSKFRKSTKWLLLLHLPNQHDLWVIYNITCGLYTTYI
jgi:hypothetical protein